jgi:hypothetical protein
MNAPISLTSKKSPPGITARSSGFLNPQNEEIPASSSQAISPGAALLPGIEPSAVCCSTELEGPQAASTKAAAASENERRVLVMVDLRVCFYFGRE